MKVSVCQRVADVASDNVSFRRTLEPAAMSEAMSEGCAYKPEIPTEIYYKKAVMLLSQPR